MDNKVLIVLIGIVAISAFLGGILVGGPGDGEESGAAMSPPPLPDDEGPKAMVLSGNDSEEENDSISDIFSKPNGIEPPSFPSS